MIFYTITDTLPVVPDWSSITGDLKAGTPISIKGAVANDEAAIGLVAGDTAHGAEYAVVVTAGVVDLNAASASYGSTISDDVVQALDNVTFIYGGKVYAVSGSSLPDYSQASDGDVLAISSGEPGWVTPSGGGGGNAAWNDALKNVVIVTLEITGANTAALECVCSDGVVFGQMYFITDLETGDISIEFGDWSNSEENPVPAADLSAITAALETAIFSHYYAVVPGYYVDITTIEQRIIVCR